MVSLVFFAIFALLVISLIVGLILFSLIDSRSYKTLEEYLFDNNINEDLIYLKLVDTNMRKQSKYRRPMLLLKYLKNSTETESLQRIKDKYLKSISFFMRMILAIIFAMIIVIMFL